MQRKSKKKVIHCDNCGRFTSREAKNINRYKQNICKKCHKDLTLQNSFNQAVEALKNRNAVGNIKPTLELLPFISIVNRSYQRCIEKQKKTNRQIYCDLTLEQVYEIFQKQQGKCAHTGILLEFTNTTTKNTPNTLSLDRIDSSGNYTKENVQFLTTAANFAKNNFTEEQMQNYYGSF